MSKNITIQEGGVAKQLTVDKLKTNLVSSGTCLWVPEDEVTLGTKVITENGTYKASDDGYYGYSEVTVNIANAGTATGTDEDGDEAVAYTDPETGELVEEKVPSRIEVITPPTNPYGIYQDGQAITTNGMVVKAYLETGGEYGTVPNGEITLNPTTAVYDPSTDTGRHGTATSDLETAFTQPISYSGTAGHSNATFTPPFSESVSAEACAGFKISSSNSVIVLYASSSSPAGHIVSSNGRDDYAGTTSYTHNGKTVYYGMMNFNDSGSWLYNGTINAVNGSPAGPDAWTMVYGTREEEQAGSHQQITVSWPRPRDGKVLETTFEILVAPGYGGDEGENGNAGTPPPGMLIP